MPAWNETDDRKLLLACIKLSVSSLVSMAQGLIKDMELIHS